MDSASSGIKGRSVCRAVVNTVMDTVEDLSGHGAKPRDGLSAGLPFNLASEVALQVLDERAHAPREAPRGRHDGVDTDLGGTQAFEKRFDRTASPKGGPALLPTSEDSITLITEPAPRVRARLPSVTLPFALTRPRHLGWARRQKTEPDIATTIVELPFLEVDVRLPSEWEPTRRTFRPAADRRGMAPLAACFALAAIVITVASLLSS
jgi:hypothetical protein